VCGGLLYAQNNPLSLTEGKKLKNLKNYRLKDFHLKKKVRYFDLRQYYTIKGYPYMRGWAFDQQAYNKLPSNLRNILASILQNLTPIPISIIRTQKNG